MAACGLNQGNECGDCVQVVRNTKTVQVPCTVNKYKQYTVRVPRQVTKKVPRTVQYTDFESRQKQVPYTDYRSERRTRMETQKYQVPVTTNHTKMVPVTKKVPKTVYVTVTSQVPQTYKKTTMQTRERQVPVPYFVNVPETKYRTVTEQVPVQKSKVQMDTVMKTVYDTKVRSRCVPETKIVTKRIPVFNVVAKPSRCPPAADYVNGGVMTDFNRIDKSGDGRLNYNEVAYDIADRNKDSQLSFGEYSSARGAGNLGNTAGYDFGSHATMYAGNNVGQNYVAHATGSNSIGQGYNGYAAGNQSATMGYGQMNGARVETGSYNDSQTLAQGNNIQCTTCNMN